MARKCLTIKVFASNIKGIFYLFVKGPIDANNITDITPSEATKMPKYRTVSSSDQPNWSIHNGVPSLEKKEGFPKEVFFSPNAFCFCSLQNLGTGFNKFANIKTFLQYCSLAILQLLLFRAIKEFP